MDEHEWQKNDKHNKIRKLWEQEWKITIEWETWKWNERNKDGIRVE